MSAAEIRSQPMAAPSFAEETGFAPLSIFEEPLRSAIPATPLLRAWRWLRGAGRMRLLQVKQRRLRVTETVSLGEKRFVSIVEVDGTSLLIGGSTASVALLKQLDERPTTPSFRGALQTAWQDGRSA